MKNGVILAIFSSLVFSIVNVLVKAASFAIPPAEIAFFRSIIGAVIIFFMMKYSKISFSTTGIPLLVLRGVLGALYLTAYFYTIAMIPLTDAVILVHLSPIFVILLSAIFLKDKISSDAMFFLFIAFAGATLLLKPYQFESYTMDAFVGILSALFAAGAAISIRHLTKKHHSYEIIFYFLAIATVISVPLMWNDFVMPNLLELFYLILIGVVSLLGLIFLTKAFTHENAIVVEVTRYIGIAFNAMWGYLLFAEVPDLLTVVGGVLIVGACIALSRKAKVKDLLGWKSVGKQEEIRKEV
ncbi:DMT family transporter [Ammoniphilus sp. CFH 90114]|uniref:DMT family transporter n=1 Tax=Ammoniphilus sp. CFH 90114 TaxID=2493665 RepID=UPI00100FC4CD|nr:DMT family transporter [Ammoniphilus sp. CFH 90114]RXT03811.1 DMT family transporter [Ammoniphilus sp. CFH 90114]